MSTKFTEVHFKSPLIPCSVWFAFFFLHFKVTNFDEQFCFFPVSFTCYYVVNFFVHTFVNAYCTCEEQSESKIECDQCLLHVQEWVKINILRRTTDPASNMFTFESEHACCHILPIINAKLHKFNLSTKCRILKLISKVNDTKKTNDKKGEMLQRFSYYAYQTVFNWCDALLPRTWTTAQLLSQESERTLWANKWHCKGLTQENGNMRTGGDDMNEGYMSIPKRITYTGKKRPS